MRNESSFGGAEDSDEAKLLGHERHANVPDHVSDFELVHGYVTQYGDKAGKSVSQEWKIATQSGLVIATVLATGEKQLALKTKDHRPRILGTMSVDSKFVTNPRLKTNSNYDLMSETLRDCSAEFVEVLERNQALISTLDI